MRLSNPVSPSVTLVRVKIRKELKPLASQLIHCTAQRVDCDVYLKVSIYLTYIFTTLNLVLTTLRNLIVSNNYNSQAEFGPSHVDAGFTTSTSKLILSPVVG